jgi:hypothetical protein
MTTPTQCRMFPPDPWHLARHGWQIVAEEPSPDGAPGYRLFPTSPRGNQDAAWVSARELPQIVAAWERSTRGTSKGFAE